MIAESTAAQFLVAFADGVIERGRNLTGAAGQPVHDFRFFFARLVQVDVRHAIALGGGALAGAFVEGKNFAGHDHAARDGRAGKVNIDGATHQTAIENRGVLFEFGIGAGQTGGCDKRLNGLDAKTLSPTDPRMADVKMRDMLNKQMDALQAEIDENKAAAKDGGKHSAADANAPTGP